MNLLKKMAARRFRLKLALTGITRATGVLWGPSKAAVDSDAPMRLGVFSAPLHGADPVSPSPGDAKAWGRRDEPEDVLEQRLEQKRVTDLPVADLMALADRFTCTTEMATFLAIMHVGGPRQLLYWDEEWDATTRRSVHRLHATLMKGCEDELEFALKLYAAWSEVHYQGQPLAPAWALRQVWQFRHMPMLSTKMSEQLGSRAAQFRKEVAAALDYEGISHLVEQYGLEEVADTWLAEMKSALLGAQQEAWTRAFFIHHSLLESRVEPERERLLNGLSSNKRERERRPINFDLLKRVRIIFAHLLTSQSAFSSSLSVSPLILIRPEWVEVLKQLGPSQLALASFISAQTRREETGELISTFAYHRVFLDQRVPLGSCYQCQVTDVAPESPIRVALVHRMSDAPTTHEEFRDEGTVVTEVGAGADEVETGERADVGDGVEAVPVPIPGLKGQRVSPWSGPANTTWAAGAAPLQRNVDDHTEVNAAPTWSASSSERQRPLSEEWPDKIVGLLHLKDQDKQDYQVGDTFTGEVVDYNFDDPVFPTVIVRPAPDPEPFEAFTDQYQRGDVVTVAVKAYDERPNDPLISLVVQEPVSHLELLLEPEQLSFTPPGPLVKAIPLGTALQAVVDEIDEEKRRVYLSCLPFMEVHLNRMLRACRSENGTYQVEAVVNQVLQEGLLLTLRWSEPARGVIYAVRVPTSSLSEPVKAYRLGQACTLRLTFPEQSSSEVLIRLPTEIKKALGVQSGFERLSWRQHRLHFNGRMSYRVRNELLSLTHDRSYRRALHHLYSLSHRFTGELIDGTTAGHARETPAEVHDCETMWDDVEQDDLQIADLLNEQATDFSSKGHETSRVVLIPGASPILNYQAGDRARGRVTGVKEFGAFVELEPGASGLVHRSKMWGYVADAREVIHPGEEIEVLILNVNVERGNLELSMQVPEHDPLLHYQVGDKAVGRVTEVKEFGAFVELEPGASGLVHRSKMWGYVADARDVVNLDNEVTVLILTVDLEKRRLELSMQVPEHDPLLRYQAGDSARGRVTEVKEFGAFVELEPGASGLVHRTEMPGSVIDARKVLNIGDEVEVLIIRVDMEERRLLLSMKEV